MAASIIQSVALKIAKQQGMTAEEFTASNSWFDNFKKRKALVGRILQGEREDAPIEDAEAFKAKLPELLAMYDPKYIYNADEVGLFYEQTGTRRGSCRRKGVQKEDDYSSHGSYGWSHGDCDRNKQFTLPQVVHQKDPKRLPPCITWFSNRKAWMVSNIFKTFLITLDSKLQKHKAEGLIFLYNFSAHELAVECTDHLKNLRVEWLPPNCTSLVQP